MTVLDAYAVIAYLRGEAAAGNVRPLLLTGDSVVTAVGLAEVLDHLVRVAGVDEEQATLDLAQLGLLDALPVPATVGAAVGRLRARHYHRTRCPVSVADCVAAESARWTDQPLATADPDLLDVCYAEGIGYLALPQSNGATWAPPERA
ncbi:PIN domain-containing protein [uncultured Jatrophihabitans sp.]|uniref:PIN domain-containing protein n=1 Tax=uncultured Jatrophihabitans sp. TaxID=1610747 RepID=UPI0035CA7CDF